MVLRACFVVYKITLIMVMLVCRDRSRKKAEEGNQLSPVYQNVLIFYQNHRRNDRLYRGSLMTASTLSISFPSRFFGGTDFIVPSNYRHLNFTL